MSFFLTNGLLSGMILASYLALCDGLFQTTTFTVLIDVSYIPALAGLPSIVELLIHLVVSVVLASVFFWFYPSYSGSQTGRYIAIWAAVLALLYLPFSLLSKQSLTFGAFAIWLTGHILYVLFLTFQVERQR